jgi:hypothetical protein
MGSREQLMMQVHAKLSTCNFATLRKLAAFARPGVELKEENRMTALQIIEEKLYESIKEEYQGITILQ